MIHEALVLGIDARTSTHKALRARGRLFGFHDQRRASTVTRCVPVGAILSKCGRCGGSAMIAAIDLELDDAVHIVPHDVDHIPLVRNGLYRVLLHQPGLRAGACRRAARPSKRFRWRSSKKGGVCGCILTRWLLVHGRMPVAEHLLPLIVQDAHAHVEQYGELCLGYVARSAPNR